MDSETPVLKWTAAAVGVILVCFCIGYFVLGPSARPTPGGAGDSAAAIATPDAIPTPAQVAAAGSGLVVDERTDEIEAKQKKAADAAKAKAAADALKKAAADAKAAAELAAANQAAALNASPSPAPSGDANTGDPSATNATDPSPIPASPDNGNSSTASDGKSTATAAAPADDTLYRVRVGGFASRDAAKSTETELNGRGYAAMIVPEKADGKTVYRLQVGAYKDKKTADGIQQELQANGYDASISN